jgi:hypothetical protein
MQAPKVQSINRGRFQKGHAPLAGGGRPAKVFDWKQFDELCAIQCTLAEIALWFRTDQETVILAVRRQWGKTFADYFEEKRKLGFVSLRRKQYQMALDGDRTMLVWLGKNLLHQADRQEITGRGGGPLQYEAVDLGKLTDEELKQLETLVDKAHAEIERDAESVESNS